MANPQAQLLSSTTVAGVAGILEAVVTSTTAIAVAAITAAIAIRNARKTPHETLKSLLELLKDSDIPPSDRVVLDNAVHREITRIGLLNDARLQGFWAYQRARLLSGMSPYMQRALFTAIILPVLTIPSTFAWPVAITISVPPEVTGDGATEVLLDWWYDNAGYRWDWGGDTLTEHLLSGYYGPMPAPGWLFLVGNAAVIVALVLLTRVAIAAARTTGLIRAWASFAALVLACQMVTYVVYRNLGGLETAPQAWIVRVGPSNCPASEPNIVVLPAVTVADSGQLGEGCIRWVDLDAPHAMGDTWIQPAPQLWMFVVSVGWVLTISLFVRLVPFVRRLSWPSPRVWTRGIRGLWRRLWRRPP